MKKMTDQKRINKAFYRSKRWQALRQFCLERAGFRCESCGRPGRLDCHHLLPIRKAFEQAFDPENIEILCRSCHCRSDNEMRGGPPPSPDRIEWQLYRGNELQRVTDRRTSTRFSQPGFAGAGWRSVVKQLPAPALENPMQGR